MGRKLRGFWYWLERLELFLLRGVVVVFVVFFVAKGFLSTDPLERIIHVFGGIEGLNFEKNREEAEETAGLEEIRTSEVTLTLVNYSSLQKAKVLINGKVRGEFLNKYLSINVKEGDILEIDGTFYSHPIKIKIFQAEPALEGLDEGRQFTVQGEVLTLGEIRFANPFQEEPVSLPTPGI